MRLFEFDYSDGNPMHKSPHQVKDGVMLRDTEDEDHFWLIGEWASVEEHKRTCRTAGNCARIRQAYTDLEKRGVRAEIWRGRLVNAAAYSRRGGVGFYSSLPNSLPVGARGPTVRNIPTLIPPFRGRAQEPRTIFYLGLVNSTARKTPRKPQPIAAHNLCDIGVVKAMRSQTVGNVPEIEIATEPGRHRREARVRGGAFAVIDALGPAADPHPFDHAIRLILAEIAAETDMVYPHQVGGCMRPYRRNFQPCNPTCPSGDADRENPNMPPLSPSAFSTSSDLLRSARCQNTGLAWVMAIGRSGDFDGLEGRPFARMAHVND